MAALRKLIAASWTRVRDVFAAWDDDGNGAIDKKEMRQAVAALGYNAPKKEIDAFFDEIDDDGNGWIEFGELKAALAQRPPARKL